MSREPLLFVFDMGGVITRERDVSARLLQYLGFEGDNLRQLGPRSAEAIEAHVRGEIDEKAFWEVVEKERGVELTKEPLLGKFFDPIVDTPTLKIVKKLKESGKRIICGTNVIDSQYEILQGRKLYDIFDKVYASNEMHLSKPDVSFYEYILREEGIPAEKIFFTDDVVVNIEAAKSLGMLAFQYFDAMTLFRQLKTLEVALCR
ncbi:MAG: HAD-IA family hydrolase [Sphaerochaetaceae bacterium]